MCRNIRTLFNFDPPATEVEIRDASLQFVRKLSGFNTPSKINAEVSGRLTESLSGVRVVKGYHAEAREHEVFTGGVQRLLENVLQSLTTMSMMSFSTKSSSFMLVAILPRPPRRWARYAESGCALM